MIDFHYSNFQLTLVNFSFKTSIVQIIFNFLSRQPSEGQFIDFNNNLDRDGGMGQSADINRDGINTMKNITPTTLHP